MSPTTLLDRILWTQLARVVYGSPPEWEAESASARAIRGVLAATELDPEESAIVERWNVAREASRVLFDRLLQARVNRAVRAGLRVEVERLGLKEVPRVPRVLIVREGGPEEERAATVAARGNPRKTVVEFLSGASSNVADMAPGAKLDELVDLLVLANQEAADELRATMGPTASVVRADSVPEIDLLLATPTPSIQVIDIERELARLEEVLRSAIPPERRPAKSGAWSFGPDLTGQSLGGKYRIKALKGKGAFKTVYEGEDEMLGARVAVAVLNPKGARSPMALTHFQDEARKLTTLDHENIVRWITFDRTAEGLTYFVMEYLDGEELEKLLRREGRLAPKRVARILLQTVAALKRAHKAGKQGSLLHLDLKPENVFVLPALAPGEPERVKVIDFGIGQHVGAEIRAAERPELRSLYDLPAEDLGKSIGSIVLPEDEEEEEEGAREETPPAASGGRRRVQRARGGTLLYSSPEQCKHLAGHKDIENLDGRSDLYSLGVMAFRMLTGQFPFPRNATAFEAIENHLKAPPRKVGSLGIKIPRALAAFVDRCLIKEREKRWQDANEAYEALERIVHPRLSPAKVSVPFAVVGALGLGALYYTRDPAERKLTLVDPAIENVSERVQTGLYLGPASPAKVLRLESDSRGWEREMPLRMLDADGGSELADWSVRWLDLDAGTIEIARLDGAKSAGALLEIDGGRSATWKSERLTLHHLGPWEIDGVTVAGHDSGKLLDPQGRTLQLEIGGDPEGRATLDSIEVLLDGASFGRTSPVRATPRGELVTYAGPALDELFTGSPHDVELRVVARDRAGQAEEKTTTLHVAGEPAKLGPDTGFIVAGTASAALLPYSSEIVLLPENALRITTTAPAHASVMLESPAEPRFEADIRDPKQPLVVALADLGIRGDQDLAGVIVITIDDATWVSRSAPIPDQKRIAFRYTPRSPELQALFTAEGLAPLNLLEQGAVATSVRVGAKTQLVVTPPAGAQLWLEASCANTQDGAATGVRMDRSSGGAFTLPLELPQEGRYRIVVQQYFLGNGEQKGPLIPPEHVFLLDVDRTEPVVALELEGADGTAADGAPLFRGAVAQHVAASVTEAHELAALEWTLTAPGGAQQSGKLAAGARAQLPPLDAYQTAEGRYVLALVATDAAGNIGKKDTAWHIARSGPELELVEPTIAGTDRLWALASGSKWNVRVRARDANGVAAVRVRVVYQKAGSELELVHATGDYWELREADRPSAHSWWSGKELALELVARDAAGFETPPVRESGKVPEILSANELVIRPRDRKTEIMVEVPVSGSYTFGGRTRDNAPRNWNVELDGLRPYFLDAREVTRGEFLEFVQAGSGYADKRWWPAGSSPDTQRAAELASAFSSETGKPATGVTWPEAFAYAAWRGKRLPTLVEWEFAVRGAGYRDRPASATPPGAPADWPANLCAGAREWTATPDQLVAEKLDFAMQCRRNPEVLLAPASAPRGGAASPSGLHWVGGPGPGGAADWTAKETCADLPGRDDLGFRCALDRETAHSKLDGGEYVPVE